MNYCEEIWVDIKGYEGLYRVSNLGRVVSLEKYYFCGTHGNQKNIVPEFLPKQFLTEKGYLYTRLKKSGSGKKLKIHRLVAEHFVYNPDNKPEVNHKDGNKINNHYSNLEWVTREENMRHASEMGLICQGAKSVLSKLTEDQVLEIRSSGESTRTLAKKYGIGKSTMWLAKSGKTYFNVN